MTPARKALAPVTQAEAKPAAIPKPDRELPPPDSAEWPRDPRKPAPAKVERLFEDLAALRKRGCNGGVVQDLVMEAVERCIEKRWAPSPALIELLLGKRLGSKSPWMDTRLAKFFGPRKPWLAGRNRELAKRLLPPASMTRAQAAKILESLPVPKPEEGRHPAPPHWRKMSRTRLNEILLPFFLDQRPSDAPLLERALVAPDGGAGESIRRLMSAWPDCAFSQRMGERVARHFKLEKDKNGPRFSYTMPAARNIAPIDRFDGCGIDRWEPGILRVSAFFDWIVAHAPLDAWTRHFGLGPVELIEAARRSKDGENYIFHWSLAQRDQMRPGWGAPLHKAALAGGKKVVRNLAPGCPEDVFDELTGAYFLKHARSNGPERKAYMPAFQSTTADLLMHHEGPISESLTRLFLDYYRTEPGLGRPDLYVFAELSRSGHPALWPEYRDTHAALMKSASEGMSMLRMQFGARYHLTRYEGRWMLHRIFPDRPAAILAGRMTKHGP